MNNTGQYNKDIKEAVQRLAGTFLKDNLRIIQATVNSVDQSAYTCNCTPISGDTTTAIVGVNLSANNNDGFIPLPAVCSTVLIAESTKNNPPYLIGWDLLQGLICIVQNQDGSISQLLIQNGTVQFNNGMLGGIPINASILTNLGALITYINTQFGTIASAIETLGDSADATTITTAITTINETIANNEAPMADMQNTKVNHGV